MTRNTDGIGVAYCRRSKDLDERGRNVAHQERECKSLAKKNGDTIARTYTDNDMSASKFARRARTEWAKLMHDIEHGNVRRIYSIMGDRVTRLPREMERLIDLAEAGLFESIIVSDEDGEVITYDLRTDDGVERARAEVAAADKEARKISRRCRTAHRRLRDEGRATGAVFQVGWLGTRHGHDNDTDRILYEPEVARLRDARARLLRGTSLSTIAREWSDPKRGVMRPRQASAALKAGKPIPPARWTAGNVRAALLNPVNTGARYYKGDVLDAHAYPAIFTASQYADIVDHFEAGKRGPRGARSSEWTGFVRCAGTMPDGSPCDATMTFNPGGGDATFPGHFKCIGVPGRRSCGNNYANAAALREHAYAWLIDACDDPEFRAMLSHDDGARRKALDALAAIGARKERLDAKLGEGWSEAAYDRAYAAAERQEQDALAALRQSGSAGPIVEFLGKSNALRNALYATDVPLTADEHRALFLSTKYHAYVFPARKRREKFIAERRIRFLKSHPKARRRRAA